MLKGWKSRTFRLTSTELQYAKSEKGPFKVVAVKTPGVDIFGGKVEGSSSSKFGFKVHAKDGLLKLFAPSESERKEWISILERMDVETIKNGNSAGKPKGNADAPLELEQLKVNVGGERARTPSPVGGKKTSDQEDGKIEKITRIEDRYELKDTLGSGGFATVKVGLEKASSLQWAIKQIKRKTVEENKHHIMQEIKIMRRLNHPHIVKLHDVVETASDLYIVMELMRGGELFDRILSKGSYSEKDTSSVLRKVVSGLAHIHGKGIAHCDLKPENLIYATPDPDADIKIIDFGLSQLVDSPAAKTVTRIVGTPEYIAPEVISRKGYATSCDMWSIGVITYILLCGYYPFYGDSIQDIFHMVYKGKFEFPPEEWSKISESAKDLIKNLLVIDPSKRFTAEQCLNHPWIRGLAAPDDAVPDNVIRNLRAFNARRRFKKGVLAVISVHKFAQGLTPRNNNNHSPSPSPSASSDALVPPPPLTATPAVATASATDANSANGSAPSSANGSFIKDPVLTRRQTSMGKVTFDLDKIQLDM